MFIIIVKWSGISVLTAVSLHYFYVKFSWISLGTTIFFMDSSVLLWSWNTTLYHEAFMTTFICKIIKQTDVINYRIEYNLSTSHFFISVNIVTYGPFLGIELASALPRRDWFLETNWLWCTFPCIRKLIFVNAWKSDLCCEIDTLFIATDEHRTTVIHELLEVVISLPFSPSYKRELIHELINSFVREYSWAECSAVEC
jgi:hypothetical protein